MGKLIKFMTDSVKNWFRKKMSVLSLAFANVEKNALSQRGEQLSSDVNQVQRHTQGQLADALVHGEVTQEVVDLRWRTYKILQHIDGLSDKASELVNIKIEPTDNYPLEMVVNNETIVLGTNEFFQKNVISGDTMPTKSKDNEGEDIAFHGTVDSTIFYATVKGQPPITVGREFFPKFNIENFAKTLHVRSINGCEKMLEFYVSKYPVEENKNSKLFLNEINKCIKNPISSKILEILEVEFTTFNTLGKIDNLHYKYKITKFDKITEFNGSYVIKYFAEELIGGENIIEKHKSEDLDRRYETKEKK